jgi:hypothetical protein
MHAWKQRRQLLRITMRTTLEALWNQGSSHFPLDALSSEKGATA